MFNACTVPTPLLRIVTASLNLLILTGSWRGIELCFLSVKKKKQQKPRDINQLFQDNEANE